MTECIRPPAIPLTQECSLELFLEASPKRRREQASLTLLRWADVTRQSQLPQRYRPEFHSDERGLVQRVAVQQRRRHERLHRARPLRIPDGRDPDDYEELSDRETEAVEHGPGEPLHRLREVPPPEVVYAVF